MLRSYMRVCNDCLIEKPLSEFHKNRGCKKYGVQPKCKVCKKRYADSRADIKREKDKARRIEKADELREQRRVYRLNMTDSQKRRNVESNARYRAKNKDKYSAHKAVQIAKNNGTLVAPDSCSECDVECTPHGHHEDYSKPLDVEWLCVDCHKRRHRRV